MIIKYITCDGETETEEEIVSAEFYSNKAHDGKTYKELYCERAPGSIYYETDGDNEFVVNFDSVEYIKD